MTMGMMQLLAAETAQFAGRTFTVDEVLQRYVWVFYAAYAVSFALTPMMRAVAQQYGIIDQPDGVRKLHTVPVAYLGGVAVLMGWLAGLAVSQWCSAHHDEPELPQQVVVNFGIVLGASVIAVLGLWDDVLGVRPSVKIMGQVLAAAGLLTTGIGTRSSWILIQPVAIRLSTYWGWPMPDPNHWMVLASSAVMVVGIVVACCNATNLLDGLDGLCGGVTAIIAAGFLFLAVNLATVTGALNVNEDGLRVILALALLGAVLAFIPYNFNPASIFMGDTGSMFLGFVCAVMIILFAAHGHFKWFLASMVVFALPVLDTMLAFARRWVARRPVFSADRHHFHHQLLARGLTVKQTVLVSYLLAVLFALLGAAIVYVRTRYALAIYLVVFGSIIVAAYKMGMVHERLAVTSRKTLGSEDPLVPAAVDPGGAVEIRDRHEPPGSAAPTAVR